MATLFITRREAECLEDALKTFNSKAQDRTKKELLRQLDRLLRGGKPRSDGWAPIRSSWPTGATPVRSTNRNSFYKKPEKATGKSSKTTRSQPLTAQQVLDSL